MNFDPNEMPCRYCDVGIYDQISIDTAKNLFNGKTREKQLKQIPQCKTRDCPCIGALDFLGIKVNALCTQPEEDSQSTERTGTKQPST